MNYEIYKYVYKKTQKRRCCFTLRKKRRCCFISMEAREPGLPTLSPNKRTDLGGGTYNQATTKLMPTVRSGSLHPIIW